MLAERRGIGRQKRGGAYRVQELPEMEDKPLPFVGIDRLPLGFLEKLFGKREITLLQQPEEGVLLPFRSVEAPVGASPHQRAAVPIQISAASRHIVRPKLAAAIVAGTGSAVDRSESVTRARVISPHEMGSSRWRGLARHSWSAISGSSSELAP